MNKIKRIIKLALRYLFQLCAIVYPYGIFLEITNAKDEITILGTILMAVYVIVAINLFEWCFDVNNFDKSKGEEIERLNNIINELEKWLVEWREMLDCPDFYEEGIIDCVNDTLTKLQELKGNDSNE